MKTQTKPPGKDSAKTTHATFIAIFVMLLCLTVVIMTIELAKLQGFNYIAGHRNVIVSVESALAISLGTVMGVIIGFATQNLISNVVSGMMLAIVRPVQIGDEITITGSTGNVKEIALIYTVLDTKDRLY